MTEVSMQIEEFKAGERAANEDQEELSTVRNEDAEATKSSYI